MDKFFPKKKTCCGKGHSAEETLVEVKLINIEWLNNNIVKFYDLLERANRPDLFENDYIKVILQQ